MVRVHHGSLIPQQNWGFLLSSIGLIWRASWSAAEDEHHESTLHVDFFLSFLTQLSLPTEHVLIMVHPVHE